MQTGAHTFFCSFMPVVLNSIITYYEMLEKKGFLAANTEFSAIRSRQRAKEQYSQLCIIRLSRISKC
jgi:hypothetical protein